MPCSSGQKSSPTWIDQRGAMKRWLPVVGVVAVLAVAWFAALYSSTDVTQLPQFPPAPSRSVKPPDPDPSIAGYAIPYVGIPVPACVLWVIVGSVILFVAIVIVSL